MKRVIPIILILLALVLFQVCLAAEKTKPMLEDIRFETPSKTEDRITFKLNTTCIPKIFAIKGEKPRVVFDFPDATPAAGIKNTMTTDGSFIRRIRIGLHGEPDPKTRVVLDLSPDRPASFDQNFNQQNNTLVISVHGSGMQVAPQVAKEKPSTPPVQKKPAPLPEKQSREPEKPEKIAVAPSAAATQAAESAGQKPASQPAVAASTGKPTAVQTTPVVQVPAKQKQPLAKQPDAGQQAVPQEAAPRPRVREHAQPAAAPAVQKTKKVLQASRQAPILESIEFDRSSNRGEMVLFKLSDFHPPIVFGIEKGLPRVVCDFQGTTASAEVKNQIKAHGRYVKTIRVGKHRNPNKIRVVLDLEPNNNYDLQQVFFKDDNLFVIIVNTISNPPSISELKKPLKKSGTK